MITSLKFFFTICCFYQNYNYIFILIYFYFYINIYFNFIICKAQLNNCINWIIWRYINKKDYSLLLLCLLLQPLDIPSIHVQHPVTGTDTVYESAIRRANNGAQVDPNSTDLYRRINALLDNSLDLSSLNGLVQTNGQAKGSWILTRF